VESNHHSEKPLVLVTLCGGGWHPEMCRILDRFPPEEFRFAYAYGHCNGVHGAARLPVPHEGPRYPIHFLGPTRWRPRHLLTNPARLFLSFIEAYRLVSRLQPTAVLALGTSTAIPLFFAAKCLGVRSVFVESLTRVERLSMTGRIVRRLGLADRLYVQWPRLAERVNGAVFAGAVL
jgi:UDP-N-acetylglucosamine:LPS N-acetylglucosamine transferase